MQIDVVCEADRRQYLQLILEIEYLKMKLI